MSPVKLQLVLKGSIWLFYRFCFFLFFFVFCFLFFWQLFLHSYLSLSFSNKSWCYSACKMPLVIVSTMGRQYKQTFNPISNLWAIFKILKLRFPHYILLFVVLFTADTKEKKYWDVPNNKLFQIHSRVFTKGRIACKLNAIFYTKSTIVYCLHLYN